MSGALRWSGTIKSKTEGMLEETRPDHAIRSSVAITKLPLGRDILKKKKNKQQQQKGEMLFLSGFFFKLSGLVIVRTALSLAQEHRKSIL